MNKSTIAPIRVGIWGLGRAGWGMHCKEIDQFPAEFQIVAGCDLEQDGFNVNVIYHLLYQSIREGKPYPIKPE